MASRVPGSTMAARAPGSAMASRVPGSAMAARAPCSAVGPGMGAALEASFPVLSPCPLRPPERPPVGWCTVGGVMSDLCSPCLVFPSLL